MRFIWAGGIRSLEIARAGAGFLLFCFLPARVLSLRLGGGLMFVAFRGVSQGREAPLGWEQRTAGMPAGSVAVVCCLSPFAGCHRGAKPPSAGSKEPQECRLVAWR